MSRTGHAIETVTASIGVLLTDEAKLAALAALEQVLDKLLELQVRPLVRVIRDDEQHQAALAEAMRLIRHDPAVGTPDAEYLELLALTLEDYEKKTFPIAVVAWHKQMRAEQTRDSMRRSVLVKPFGDGTHLEHHPEERLTRNAVQCLLCNEIIESKHTHDFVSCQCGNVSVDGGLEYVRRAYKSEKTWIDLSEPLAYRPQLMSGPEDD